MSHAETSTTERNPQPPPRWRLPPEVVIRQATEPELRAVAGARRRLGEAEQALHRAVGERANFGASTERDAKQAREQRRVSRLRTELAPVERRYPEASSQLGASDSYRSEFIPR